MISELNMSRAEMDNAHVELLHLEIFGKLSYEQYHILKYIRLIKGVTA